MPRRRPEDVIQRAVFQHIRTRGVKGLVAVHYPGSDSLRISTFLSLREE
jgi:hypothetical protein